MIKQVNNLIERRDKNEINIAKKRKQKNHDFAGAEDVNYSATQKIQMSHLGLAFPQNGSQSHRTSKDVSKGLTSDKKDSQKDTSDEEFDGEFSAAQREALHSERQLQLIESRYAS